MKHIKLNGQNCWLLSSRNSVLAALLLLVNVLNAQIWNPEGLNMPGQWNGFTNPPTNNLALASATQVAGGRVAVITTGVRRYQTIFNTVTEVTAATHQFKFTSGGGNPWANEWCGGLSATLNTLQTYNMGGANASIILNANRWYTMNWRDAGYTATSAIFMETSSNPVQILNVTQSPLAASVTPANAVVVTATTDNSVSSEERLFLRYTTNNFAASTLVEFSMTGATGTATIPTQVNGTSVAYYVFSSTRTSAAIGTDYDMSSIRINNNSGGNYSYVSTSLPPVNITFQVNMSNETVGGSVNIAGTFNGFTPQAMSPIGGGLYSLTVSLAQGQNIEYKFLNGSTYENNIGAPCGNGNDRTYTVPSSNFSIPVACFSSCSNCVSTVSVTFRVDMSQQTVSGDGVHIAGDFQGWNPGGSPMTNSGGGIYTRSFNLIAGQAYSYKFVNGNAWGADEAVPIGCANSGNRSLTVPVGGGNVALVCYASCSACIAPTFANVTFRVDMSNETVSGNGVHIAGSFQGFDPSTSPMTSGAGGVYTRTFSLQEGLTYQYKFVNGNAWGSDESVPGGCNTSGNRSYTVPVGGGNVNLVCYGSCTTCSPTMVNVTFRVDMSQQTVSGDGVHIAGDFQGWNPAGSPLTNSGGGIYTRTFSLAQGTTVFYKFVNGNAWGSDESVPGGCNTSGNRSYTVPVGGGNVNLVCYGSCTTCSPTMVNVTFRVNMSQQTVSGDGVHIAGDFQGWNPAGSPLTNSGGGIYTRTFSLAQGTTVFYKFVNGNAWGSDESVPGACNSSGNRSLVVPVGGGNVAVVCYGSCSACPVGNVSLQNGAWENTNTWTSGVVPSAGADVTIASGTTVTINSAVSIGVATINGTLLTNQNLTINGGGTVAGQLTIASNQILSVTASTLNSTGMITLKSGASLMHGSGTTNGGGLVTGNFRMERQGFSGVGYSFMSSPMQNVNVAGIGLKRYSYNTLNGSSIVTTGVDDLGWTLIPGALNMQQGAGYAILSPGLAIMNGVNPREGTTNITVSVPGGTTNDMNLLGNPFPSAISASAFMAANGPSGVGAIAGTIYYWDNPAPFSGSYLTSDYATWNGAGGVGGGGNTPNGTIAAGQGFFSRGLINNQTVSYTNSMRVTNNAQFFDQTPIGRVRLSVNSANHYNETLIAFLDAATDDFDDNYDAEKFVGNPALAMYSHLASKKMVIQSFAPVTASRSVNIGIQTNLNVAFTFKLKELENFDPTISVILEDRETGAMQNLRVNSEYVVEIGSMSLNDRFVIHFGAPIAHQVINANCEEQAKVQITSVDNQVMVTLKDQNGLVLSTEALNNQLEFNNLAAGNYILDYTFADGYSVNVLFDVAAISLVTMNEELPLQVSVIENQTLNLNANVSGADSYTWFLNYQIISETADLNYVFDQAGDFQLTFVAQSIDCAISKAVVVSVSEELVNSLTDVNSLSLSIYPNPAKDFVVLNTTSMQASKINVAIYDAAMRLVFSTQANAYDGLVQIDIAQLEAGIYTVISSTEQARSATKLVKQ